MRISWPGLGALVAWAAAAAPLAAQSPGGAARVAMERARRLARGYSDLEARLTIRLQARHGDARTWAVRLLSLEQGENAEKTLVIFEEPRDVRGTALLTSTSPGKDDEQWLYLPALKRVKRIASGNRTGSFMGTEFSYEDIASDNLEKYRYGDIRRDTLDGVPVLGLERYPLDPASAYRRHVVWLDAEYRPVRIDLYDRADALVKTLHYRGYRLRAGRYWRADEMEMVNHKTGASTTLHWSEFRFGVGLSQRDFEPAALGRIP